MTQPCLSQEQEAKLAEALALAQDFEQKARELSELGDAFAEKWERSLHTANQAVTNQQGNE